MHKLPRRLVARQSKTFDRITGFSGLAGDGGRMSESKKLWGGRFEGKTDPGFAEFNNSYCFDRRLFEADITASIAYCDALVDAGVIEADEGSQIRNALDTIIQSGAPENHSAED